MRRNHTDPKLERLRRLPVFTACNARQLQIVGSLADEVTLPVGTVLAKEGRQPTQVLLINQGQLSARRSGAAVTCDDPLIGAREYTTRVPHGETILAASPVKALAFDLRGYQRLISELPDLLDPAAVEPCQPTVGATAPAVAY